jgi:uncharacterized membrane protein YdbT with pleckstrin-like domain
LRREAEEREQAAAERERERQRKQAELEFQRAQEAEKALHAAQEKAAADERDRAAAAAATVAATVAATTASSAVQTVTPTMAEMQAGGQLKVLFAYTAQDAFVPQLLLGGIAAVVFAADLPFACLLQVLLFVMFNKVITSQVGALFFLFVLWCAVCVFPKSFFPLPVLYVVA